MLLFKTSDDARTSGTAEKTQERLIRVATRLFQQRGYHGVGLNEILVEADAPKGSLYYHFPGGKSELACACVETLTKIVVDGLMKGFAKTGDVGALFRFVAEDTERWLQKTQWQDGSLLAILAQESGAKGPLSDAVKSGYAAIETALYEMLVEQGKTQRDAKIAALSILSVHEGALILARGLQSAEPLFGIADLVERLIAGAHQS